MNYANIEQDPKAQKQCFSFTMDTGSAAQLTLGHVTIGLITTLWHVFDIVTYIWYGVINDAPNCVPPVLDPQRIDINSVNTLRPRQNDRHFANETFKCILKMEPKY